MNTNTNKNTNTDNDANEDGVGRQSERESWPKMKMVGLSGNASSCTQSTLEQNQMGQINLHLVQFGLSENHL